MTQYSARQMQLTDAMLRIVARDGLQSASFRAVAAEAGCSLGAVQKAFPSKEALLAATFRRLREQAVSLPAGEPGRPTLRGWIVELLMGILPLDEERRMVTRQGEAFGQWVLSDPAAAAAVAEDDQRIRGLLASLVARGRAEGEVPPQVDPDAVAWAILALAQGLASQLLYAPEPENAVAARLKIVIDSMLR